MAKLSADKIIIILTVISATLLELIDTSIVNVALNQMMGNLGASFEEIGWVITSYAISNIIMITLSGWLSAKFGRKYYFASSIALFTVGSILCGTSTNIWELVFFRFVQGIGGGGLISTSQAILIDTFEKEDLPIAMAIFGLGVIVGPTVGPTLGGYITDVASWQWIFFVNVPFGIIATILSLTYIVEPKDKITTGKMDWFGLALLVSAIFSLQIVLERGQSEDWFQTRYITVCAVLGIASIVGFIWRMLTVKDPIVHLTLFKNRAFATGTVFNLIVGFGLFGSTLIIPVYCQNLLGLSAMQAGLVMLPGSLATAVTMPSIGMLVRKKLIHPAFYTGIGLILFFGCCFMLSRLNTDAGEMDFFWPLILRGVGMAMIFTPLNTMTVATLEGREIPQGTSLNNMVRQLGGSAGIALITTYIAVSNAQRYSDLSANINTGSTPFQERLNMLTGAFVAKGYALHDAASAAYTAIQGTLYKQATMLTYDLVFLYLGCFFVVILPLLLLFRTNKVIVRTPEEEEMIAEGAH